jgi:hypothetical protein
MSDSEMFINDFPQKCSMADEKGSFLKSVLSFGRSEKMVPDAGPIDTVDIGPKKVVPYKQTFGWYPHRIKYKGLLDLDKLYRVMALWFKQHRFELHETLFKSKPPEMEMTWRAERKRTPWVKEWIKMNMRMWGEYNIEVIENGQKKKMANVRIVIEITGDVEQPYDDIFGKPRWTATNIERRLLIFFQRFVMIRELGGLYFDQLYYEMYSFYDLVKSTLKFGAR